MIKLSLAVKRSSVRTRLTPLHKTTAKHYKTIIVLAASFLCAGCYLPEDSTATTCNHYITPAQAIKCVFPKHLRQTATRIAQCESTALAPEAVARRYKLGRWAKNGQYVGVFQMGKAERRKYGFYRRGASALVQVRSAYRLYLDRGWQPWSCA